MEFLKALFGDKALTFDELAQVINAHNGNEANKENQIKVANLGSGEYVGKGKHDALAESLKGKEAELLSANELIAELKKGTKGNEELQGKITGYETQVADLQAQLQETKIKAAVKVALLSEKAVDVDYLTYKLNEKLKEKGETLTLDENDNIKGWDALKDGLKTQFPTMFESASGSSMRVLGDNTLPAGNGNRDTVTKEQFAKMGYNARVDLREKNPELYSELTK